MAARMSSRAARRAGQVAAIAPYSLAGKSSTQVVLEYNDSRSDPITLAVVAARPAFFTADKLIASIPPQLFQLAGPRALISTDG